jgi:dipeptidyl aminopeptidase/acylaminoacyl peptidase
LHDVVDDQPTILGWSSNSQRVYVQAENGLSSAILALPIDSSAPQPLCEPEGFIAAADINEDGKTAFVLENFTQPQTVHTVDLAAQTPVRSLVQPTAQHYPNGPLPQVRVLQWQSEDGFAIEGMLYLPAGYDQERDGTLPLLLHIHGGPMSIFQRQFAATPYYYTPAALCERGIALLRCNPRGSGGYGRDFRYANMEDWGGGDFRDLMQGVDLIIEQGIADPARLGICGWSYGGYMSSWAITQTERFVAASIGAPVTNPISFIGTSDIPSFIPGFFGGEFWQSTDLIIERGPLFHAHKVTTPSIIQHGDADERVPLEQGLQYYMALERNGIPVEMYIYPRQGHAITEPHLLADAIQRNLDWFSAKLLTTGT